MNKKINPQSGSATIGLKDNIVVESKKSQRPIKYIKTEAFELTPFFSCKKRKIMNEWNYYI